MKGPVTYLLFSRDGNYIYSASTDRSIKIFEI